MKHLLFNWRAEEAKVSVYTYADLAMVFGTITLWGVMVFEVLVAAGLA